MRQLVFPLGVSQIAGSGPGSSVLASAFGACSPLHPALPGTIGLYLRCGWASGLERPAALPRQTLSSATSSRRRSELAQYRSSCLAFPSESSPAISPAVSSQNSTDGASHSLSHVFRD